jgi:hypothetical protein
LLTEIYELSFVDLDNYQILEKWLVCRFMITSENVIPVNEKRNPAENSIFNMLSQIYDVEKRIAWLTKYLKQQSYITILRRCKEMVDKLKRGKRGKQETGGFYQSRR